MNKVAAVVVTYNRLELLKECIENLLSQTSPCDVLIVDNASTDGTGAYISKQYADRNAVFYKNTGANIGGAGGFNFGMRWAVEAGYEFVWVMDDDCIPNKDALEKLLEADEILQGNYGWLSSVVLWKDGHECKMNRPKYKKRCEIKKNLRQALQASFVSLFVKRQIIVKYGLPIKEFFIWGDDIEYTRRLAVRANEYCYVVDKSIVIHKMKSNSGSDISSDAIERLYRYRLAYRNEYYLYKKEGVAGLMHYVLKVIYNLLKITKSNNKNIRAKMLIEGVLSGIDFNPKVDILR